MSDHFKSSYFCLLPNELLIKILSEIDTFTLLTFCDVYDCDYFLKDRNVIKTIDVCKQYKLEDIAQISNKIEFEHVTTLNINCLYWVQASKLRRFVKRFVNLETLYAIQTNLSLTPSDTDVFSKLKIKKLGVSMKPNDALGTHEMSTIETLYVNAIETNILLSIVVMQQNLPRLSNLWVEVMGSNGKRSFLHCLNAESMNKLFFQINSPIPCINFEHYLFTTYYDNRRACQPYVTCFERFSSQQLRPERDDENNEKAESWKILEELHCWKPYGPRDARKLILNENSLDDILFEELNFHHTGPICNDRCREAVVDILKSENSKHIKKLCIMMCLFQNKNATECVNLKDSNSFTKKRIGIKNVTTSHPVSEIFRKFPGLQHLEICVCEQTPHHNAIQGYPLIALFENLQSLTVQVPITLDGSFLIEVLKKCKNLQTLKIISSTQNEKLNYNVCNAIAEGTSLKDFKYENRRIQLNRLLENLCLIKSKKLERIVLICQEVDQLSESPLKEFLEGNPQLVFLYFLIENWPGTSLRMAQQTLNLYKRIQPSKVFLVKKSPIMCGYGSYPIPETHFSELLNNNNNIGSLHALEDFLYF